MLKIPVVAARRAEHHEVVITAATAHIWNFPGSLKNTTLCSERDWNSKTAGHLQHPVLPPLLDPARLAWLCGQGCSLTKNFSLTASVSSEIL